MYIKLEVVKPEFKEKIPELNGKCSLGPELRTPTVSQKKTAEVNDESQNHLGSMTTAPTVHIPAQPLQPALAVAGCYC